MDQTLFFVFFIYGLAFFGMGLAMLMESWRASSLAAARVLLPLSGFGLIHGTHEWFEAYILQAQGLGTTLPQWMAGLRLGLLIVSFSSLAWFAFQSLRLVSKPTPIRLKYGGMATGVYILAIIISAVLTYDHQPFQIQSVLDGMARYLLAVPASVLAAIGLHYINRTNPNPSSIIQRWLDGAAAGFLLYGLTQIFVQPIAMFPASILNQESFRATLGFPIQAVRTAMAALITVCLLRATQVTEERRNEELMAAQKARFDALEQQQNLRRELLRHTVRAQEDERGRIARELHDETSQTLTAFSLELATLKNELPRRSASIRTVDRLLDLSRDASQGLYRVITGLRPAQLDELGVSHAIRSLVDRDYTPNGFSITVEVTGTPRRLDPIVETVLYRVAQEALKNLARHAQVQKGRVSLRCEEGQIVLSVSDGGRGFNPAENFQPPRGWGLEGMKERVASIGGTLKIHSTPGQGTLIEALIPVAPDGKEQS